MKKVVKKNIEAILALTPMQEGMLFHYLKDPGSDYYFEQLCLEVSGEIDRQCFEKAWDFVIETNEMLRTFFRWEKVKNPIQVTLKGHRVKPGYYDLSSFEHEVEIKRRVEKIKREDRDKGFDLREVPFRVIVCKIPGNNYNPFC